MNILLLNACSNNHPAAALFGESLNAVNDVNDSLTVVHLSEKKISPCGACMLCQIKTPGICIKKDDMEHLLPLYVCSDVVVFVTPLVCGGYSSVYKKFLDRICPVLTACFEKRFDETWHIPRYKKRPVVIGAGIMDEINSDKEIFERLFIRNMKQLFIENYSFFVFSEKNDMPQLKTQFLLSLRKAGVAI